MNANIRMCSRSVKAQFLSKSVSSQISVCVYWLWIICIFLLNNCTSTRNRACLPLVSFGLTPTGEHASGSFLGSFKNCVKRKDLTWIPCNHKWYYNLSGDHRRGWNLLHWLGVLLKNTINSIFFFLSYVSADCQCKSEMKFACLSSWKFFPVVFCTFKTICV